MTSDPTLLALDALATYRLTRLVGSDTITAPVRLKLAGSRYIDRRDMTGMRAAVVARPKLAEFITCPWCVSPWIAVAIVLLGSLAASACLVITAVLAFSAIAGIISERV
jgi:hypothetical protein